MVAAEGVQFIHPFSPELRGRVLRIGGLTIKRMRRYSQFGRNAGVAELVDAPGLGPGG